MISGLNEITSENPLMGQSELSDFQVNWNLQWE